MKQLTANDLAFFLGAKCQITDGFDREFFRVIQYVTPSNNLVFVNEVESWFAYMVKPILRHISSLTEGEAQILWRLVYESETFYSETTYPSALSWWNEGKDKWMSLTFIWRRLLKWHIDIFGWIDAGLALDAATVDQRIKITESSSGTQSAPYSMPNTIKKT